MPDAFTQAIHDCAMETEDNLIVFVRAAQSFEEFRKNLISSFAKKLEEKLKKKFFDGWEIDAKSFINNPFITYSTLSIWSRSWHKNLRVSIETTNSCKSVVYGIDWNPDYADPAMSDNIFETINQKIPSGTKNKYWPWLVRANKFYNWSQENALTSMRQVVKEESPAEILDFFYNELVAIVEALDNCINEWNRRNPNP